ncbi:MAG: flagellar M-ring protein FliF [Treponema sp.]|jgi:flagellar M-ring protein FliF|nr:flagellar M-ring protein FliF [Treponema sp.]
MNDFIKKMMGQINKLWGQWSMIQRAILVGIVVIVIGGIAALLSVSSTPSLAPVIDAPIRDEAALDRIVLRINQEGVKTIVSPTGLVQVADETTARRMRAILIREDLIPTNIDPWAIFDRERWTITDFERNVNFRRAQTQMITEHIKAIDDVDDANVTIVLPERELFVKDQNPTTVSVIITPRPGSDITTNRKKVEGIQKILKFAIEGLRDDNIVITDQSGVILNNFTDMAAIDRLTIIDKEQKQIQQLEAKYRADILRGLQATFSADRVRDLNIKIDMDMSKKAVDTEEFFPFTLRPRTPGLAYDDSEILKSVPRAVSTSTTKWEGTGYNPEGPGGVEGQTPPAFKDMSNLYGRMTQETNVQNEEINRKVTQEERSPQIDRVTVSVNIDGTWKWKYNEKKEPVIQADGTIEREYVPVPPDDLRKSDALVRGAIGYNAARGDSVTVQNIPFDRTKEFGEEDAAYFREKQMQTTVVVILSGLTLLLICFIIFRVVAREMERRRRLAEEERARREQALRESAMMEAEQEGMEVSISMEERSRMELMESVVNLTKEHPEDCAQLIRTWLLEE